MMAFTFLFEEFAGGGAIAPPPSSPNGPAKTAEGLHVAEVLHGRVFTWS